MGRKTGPSSLQSSGRVGTSEVRSRRTRRRGLPLGTRRLRPSRTRAAALEHVETGSDSFNRGQSARTLAPTAPRNMRAVGTADERVVQARARTRHGMPRRATRAAAARRGAPASREPTTHGAGTRTANGAEAPAAAHPRGEHCKASRRQPSTAEDTTRRPRRAPREKTRGTVGTAKRDKTMHNARRARHRPSAAHAVNSAESTSAKNHEKHEEGRTRPHQRAPARGRITGGRPGGSDADGSRPARPKKARANGSMASGEDRPEAPCLDRPSDPAPSEEGATAAPASHRQQPTPSGHRRGRPNFGAWSRGA